MDKAIDVMIASGWWAAIPTVGGAGVLTAWASADWRWPVAFVVVVVVGALVGRVIDRAFARWGERRAAERERDGIRTIELIERWHVVFGPEQDMKADLAAMRTELLELKSHRGQR